MLQMCAVSTASPLAPVLTWVQVAPQSVDLNTPPFLPPVGSVPSQSVPATKGSSAMASVVPTSGGVMFSQTPAVPASPPTAQGATTWGGPPPVPLDEALPVVELVEEVVLPPRSPVAPS